MAGRHLAEQVSLAELVSLFQWHSEAALAGQLLRFGCAAEEELEEGWKMMTGRPFASGVSAG